MLPINYVYTIYCETQHGYDRDMQTLLGIAQLYVEVASFPGTRYRAPGNEANIEGKTTDLVGHQQIVYKNLFS